MMLLLIRRQTQSLNFQPIESTNNHQDDYYINEAMNSKHGILTSGSIFSLSLYIYIYIHMYVCIYVYVYIYIYICMYVGGTR